MVTNKEPTKARKPKRPKKPRLKKPRTRKKKPIKKANTEANVVSSATTPVEKQIEEAIQKVIQPAEPVVKTPKITKTKIVEASLVEPDPPKASTSGYLVLVAVIALIAGIGYIYKEKVDEYVTMYKNKFTVVSELPVVDAQVAAPKKANNELVKIREIRKFYLAGDRADNKIEIRTGGSSGWRYHNPGKMAHGDFTRMMGALGSDGELAVFPSYDLGRRAMYIYLFTDASTYKDMTLEEAFKKYAINDITAAAGVSKQTVLKDLTEPQKEKVLNTIQKAEKWIEGKVTVFENEEDFKTRGW